MFLRLGLTSFGGPVAHLGYFRDEFVVRRRWLPAEAQGDLLLKLALVVIGAPLAIDAHSFSVASNDLKSVLTEITRRIRE